MQLMVIKADGTKEEYLHTKVMAAFVNAFAASFENNLPIARQLAESVTFYLYRKHSGNEITSGEIMSIIQAVLTSTGYDEAAVNLIDHRCRRELLRARIQVAKLDIQKLSDVVALQQSVSPQLSAWNKSIMIKDLIAEHNLDCATARTIASMVEEKILACGLRLIPADFIRFLVLLQTQAILSAQQQLDNKETTVSSMNNAFKDECLRQPRNGLCSVVI